MSRIEQNRGTGSYPCFAQPAARLHGSALLRSHDLPEKLHRSRSIDTGVCLAITNLSVVGFPRTQPQEAPVYADVYSVGWPDAPHRCLRSSVAAAQAFQGEVVGEGLNLYTGNRYPIRRFECLTISKATQGTIAAMPQWAGESVAGVKNVQPAAEIIHELAGDAERLLRRWS
jgi:hypothetical protein